LMGTETSGQKKSKSGGGREAAWLECEVCGDHERRVSLQEAEKKSS